MKKNTLSLAFILILALSLLFQGCSNTTPSPQLDEQSNEEIKAIDQMVESVQSNEYAEDKLSDL